MLQLTSNLATTTLVILTLALVIIFASSGLAAVSIGMSPTLPAAGFSPITTTAIFLFWIGMRRSTLSYNVTSARYNGISLSAVPSCRRENSTGASIIAYYLANPPQGSNTISTTGGSGAPLIRSAVSVVGANTAGIPFGLCITSSGNSTSASVSVSSASARPLQLYRGTQNA